MKPDNNAPWIPPKWEDHEAVAIDAVCKGEATPEQQRYAMDFIVNKLCGTYDMPYHSGSADDTAFACGRMFVGQQIVALPKKYQIIKNARRKQND